MGQDIHKKQYSITEGYRLVVDGIRTIKTFINTKRTGLLSDHFIERIMLAVTEVNGCEICSYGHTKIALEMGMSEDEIHQILTGQMDDFPAEESKAIFFAQHYADMKGKPAERSWHEIVSHYGEEKALAILSSIRIIMIGNSYGIAFGSLKNRIQGKKVESSSFGYELVMILSLFFAIPFGAAQALIESLIKRPLLTYSV
ncbi:MAG TPA: carboxymuconolactone decarboxylase family protein [Pseudogracilibacillus sp.]|nr:carboxymuconolactone decarboxylase family protein [Pseudogracilibacillus sp.]